MDRPWLLETGIEPGNCAGAALFVAERARCGASIASFRPSKVEEGLEGSGHSAKTGCGLRFGGEAGYIISGRSLLSGKVAVQGLSSGQWARWLVPVGTSANRLGGPWGNRRQTQNLRHHLQRHPNPTAYFDHQKINHNAFLASEKSRARYRMPP